MHRTPRTIVSGLSKGVSPDSSHQAVPSSFIQMNRGRDPRFFWASSVSGGIRPFWGFVRMDVRYLPSIWNIVWPGSNQA